jgi:hypothetical protein
MQRVNLLRLASVVLAICAASSRPAKAVCVTFPLNDKENNWVKIAFIGTATHVIHTPDGVKTTFAVSVVYRGAVGQQIVVYSPPPVQDEDVSFKEGQGYLVFSRHQTAEERAAAGILPNRPEMLHTFGGCSVYPIVATYELQHILRGVFGHPPR